MQNFPYQFPAARNPTKNVTEIHIHNIPWPTYFVHWKNHPSKFSFTSQNWSLKQEPEPCTLTLTERLIPLRTHKWFLLCRFGWGNLQDRQAWPHYRLFINILFVGQCLKQTTTSKHTSNTPASSSISQIDTFILLAAWVGHSQLGQYR